MAGMRNRSFPRAVSAALLAGLLSGCGLARQLTTQHRTYTYSVSLPPVPANTMGHGQVTLDEQVQNTYNKYHGGVDWTRLAYQARNSSALQSSTLKVYVSLADAVRCVKSSSGYCRPRVAGPSSCSTTRGVNEPC